MPYVVGVYVLHAVLELYELIPSIDLVWLRVVLVRLIVVGLTALVMVSVLSMTVGISVVIGVEVSAAVAVVVVDVVAPNGGYCVGCSG